MAKMPVTVDLKQEGEGPEQLLRLSLKHPDIAPFVERRDLELFIYSRITVGDVFPGRFHWHTPVLLLACSGQLTVRMRWVDDERLSRDYALGVFGDRPRIIVLPPQVHYQFTVLAGSSSLLGFRAWQPGQRGLDETLAFPPGYDDTQAIPPDRR